MIKETSNESRLKIMELTSRSSLIEQIGTWLICFLLHIAWSGLVLTLLLAFGNKWSNHLFDMSQWKRPLVLVGYVSINLWNKQKQANPNLCKLLHLLLFPFFFFFSFSFSSSSSSSSAFPHLLLPFLIFFCLSSSSPSFIMIEWVPVYVSACVCACVCACVYQLAYLRSLQNTRKVETKFWFGDLFE